MNWMRTTLIVCVLLNSCFASAQDKLLSLQELSNCKVYSIHYSDTLKNSEAYRHAEEVYAIRYRHEPYHVNTWQHADSDFPFTASDFPNLQFLTIATAADIPSNLAQFKNLQVLFLVDEIDSAGYAPGDEAQAVALRKPVLFPEQLYELHHLKVLYSNAHRPLYHYGRGLPNSMFFFDVKKLSAMKSLELVDLDDAFMDDKLAVAFFCPNLKVVVQSNVYSAVFGDVNGNLHFYHERNPPQVAEFKTRQGELLLVDEKVHSSGNPRSYECIHHTESEVLKVYNLLLHEKVGKQKPALKNELTIYESPRFGYRANWVIMDGEQPVLDTSALETNELFAGHTGFSDSRIDLMTTYYYYPVSNSYLIKTTFYNKWHETILELKSCYPLSDQTVELKQLVVENRKRTEGKGKNRKIIESRFVLFEEGWLRREKRY